jgi:leucyl aminopeptidase
MKITVTGRAVCGQVHVLLLAEGDGLQLLPQHGLDATAQGLVRQALHGGEFTGKAGQVCLLRGGGDHPRHVVLAGLGKRNTLQASTVRKAVGSALRALCSISGIRRICCPLPECDIPAPVLVRWIALGALTGAWEFRRYRTEPATGSTPAELAVMVARTGGELQAAAAEAVVLGQCMNWSRDLATEPANVLTPLEMSRRLRVAARQQHIKCTVLDERALEQAGARLHLAVAAGSHYPARLVIMEYGDARRRPFVLVGKGVTFDTGGVDLKPPTSLDGMKYDMCGAAAVAGALLALAQLQAPVHLVGLMPLVENHLGGRALRPGDIVRSLKGLTVEINNTDAEGRLLLADALALAQKRYRPAAMVDMATLTGACVTALGHHCAGVMGNDDNLINTILSAGQLTGDRCWRLPLWDEYQEQLSTPHADVSNVGGKPAGSITGACFLSRFVTDTPWAHIDIAGVADLAENRPHLAAGATGFGVALLTETVRHWVSAE